CQLFLTVREPAVERSSHSSANGRSRLRSVHDLYVWPRTTHCHVCPILPTSTVLPYAQLGGFGLLAAVPLQPGFGRKIRARRSPRQPFCQSASTARRSFRVACMPPRETVGPTLRAA